MHPIPPVIKIFWNINFCVSCLTNNWNIWHRSITNGIMENTFIKFSKVISMLYLTKYPMDQLQMLDHS